MSKLMNRIESIIDPHIYYINPNVEWFIKNILTHITQHKNPIKTKKKIEFTNSIVRLVNRFLLLKNQKKLQKINRFEPIQSLISTSKSFLTPHVTQQQKKTLKTRKKAKKTLEKRKKLNRFVFVFKENWSGLSQRVLFIRSGIEFCQEWWWSIIQRGLLT